jgi:hypothetical protein
MSSRQEEALVESGSSTTTLTVEVENVTRTRSVQATFQSDLNAGAAAAALAARLSCPAETPYALRSNRSAAFLDEARPIGEQIATGERLTLAPRAHLGQ